MPDLNFEERYEFAVQFLQRRHAYLAVAVIRLGQVSFSEFITTAAIVASGRSLQLVFNPDFCRTLNGVELAGVLVHEGLHLVLEHQKRMAKLRTSEDRHLFNLACDAVINDMILASFPELKLPGEPITGPNLVGQNTSQMSAEEVFRLLRSRTLANPRLWEQISISLTLDDHSLWTSTDAAHWTEATSALAVEVLKQAGDKDPCASIVRLAPGYGTAPLGQDRWASPESRCRKNLARFLLDILNAQTDYFTDWTHFNRKLVSVYPQLILPSYDLNHAWEVLIAIDSSGSVPAEFIAVALQFARQRILRTRITVISFDTVYYEVAPDAVTVKGGGGTRAQAVEEFIRDKLPRYPHHVFILTDGWTPKPEPRHPDRWIWLLPPWGSTEAIPKGSRREFFETTEVRAPWKK